MNNCYGVCFNNATIDSFLHNWKKFLNRDNSFAIIDNQGAAVSITQSNIFSYNEASLRNSLNITHDVSKRHYWNSQGNRNIIWFYAHFRMLNFYLSHPNYDYYWFFDDDVDCTNWDEFFKNVKYDSDFLAYFVFKKDGVTSQPLVSCIDSRTHSGQGWFERFPGDGDKLPEVNNQIFGSFYPVVRYSNKALNALKLLNEQGYHGYSEGFVPTVLNNLGFTLDTLYTPENVSRHFDIDSVKITHKHQTINWQWL
jgi:hypothetical protein